jgi:hypothetical protein
MERIYSFCLFPLTLFPFFVLAQGPMKIDLQDAVAHDQIEVFNRDMTLIKEREHPGIRLSKAFGEGLAWVKGADFSNGTIELDIRGEDVKQHSFVGIAFHGQNDSTFDAIYLRPFHFLSQDTMLQKRMIQYISLPVYSWRKLRAEHPNTYENAIHPISDPNGWVHLRIDVMDDTISAYFNYSSTPSLVVQKVTDIHTGSIGFYVADTSGGDFSNLVILKENEKLKVKN